jgi:hypothetical protein
MADIRSILIALPTVGHFMKSDTAIAVAKTVKALEQRGINVGLHNIDSAEIVTARDMFANMLLHSPAWDAMLFVDADMGFSERLILKLIEAKTEIAAAACPRRTLDLHRLIMAAQAHGNMDKARAAASDFTVGFSWDEAAGHPPKAVNGFCSATTVGMAIALIRRSAIEAMVEAKVVEPRLDLNASGGESCYSFFGILDNQGHRLGEDYSFCYRWTKLMGRKILVCIDEEVSHVGDFRYTARFADLL